MRRRHSSDSRMARRVAPLLIVLGLAVVPITPVAGMAPISASWLKPDGRLINSEVPTIADTDYAIPVDARFVAPTGLDTNPGTLAAPFKTITRAVAASPAGSTIVLRGGTYREQVPALSKKLTIQAYPHEKPWMKGSVVTSGWVADGPRWRLNNWTTEFCRTCVDSRAIDPAYPLAGWPDMVFVNGRPLTQVNTLAQVVGNAFMVDYAANTIHIGVTPVNRMVEASAYAMAFNSFPQSSGTVIRGLGFSQYAPFYNVTQNAMVRVNASNWTIESNTFAYSAHNGLVLYSSQNSVVRNNTFLYTGSTAVGGYQPRQLLIEGNRVAYANQEKFGVSWAIAGIKLGKAQGLTVRDNVIEGNASKGFWCDDGCYDFTVTGNFVRENAQHGIMFELSSKGLVAGNVVVKNATYGLRFDGTNNVRVYNNTLIRNWINLSFWDNTWNNTNPAEILLGITWITGENVVYNNILSNTNATGMPLMNVRDLSVVWKPASVMLAASDNNAWYRTNPALPGVLVEWWETKTVASKFANLAAYRTATGRELNSLGIDGGTNPFFVNETAGNYSLRPDSPAVGAGAPLPADMAAALGLPAGIPVNLGAPLPVAAP